MLDPLLCKNQNRFRPGRGCPEHILCLRHLIEGFKVKGGGGVIIDFRKAFDSLRRECIPPLLTACCVPLAMICGIMALYTDTTAIVLTSDGYTDPFHASKGILQGDTLAPFLFVLAVDWMMRRALTQELMAGRGVCVTPCRSSRNPAYYLSDLDFADDIALLSHDMSTAQKILTTVKKSAILVGLTINKSKTEYMVCGEVTADVGVQEPVTLSVDAGPIVKVDDFRYVGGWLKSSNDDFRHRVPQAWQACNSMWRIWKCYTLSRDCKRTLFQATVGTVSLYNAETWTTTHALERRIDGIYTRLLRIKLSTFHGNST